MYLTFSSHEKHVWSKYLIISPSLIPTPKGYITFPKDGELCNKVDRFEVEK